jgi:hypothetical protein
MGKELQSMINCGHNPTVFRTPIFGHRNMKTPKQEENFAAGQQHASTTHGAGLLGCPTPRTAAAQQHST